MADFDSLLDEVLQKLPQLNLDQLTECCTQLAIDVPEAKKEKKTAVRSLVLNHLSQDAFAEQVDVVDVLAQMNDSLANMIQGKAPVVAVAEAASAPDVSHVL